LNIVDSYEGDVVKFCGDAILIMWSTNVNASASNKKAVTMKASLCALHLIDECGSYRKIIHSSKNKNILASSTANNGGILHSISNLFTESLVSPSSRCASPKNNPRTSILGRRRSSNTGAAALQHLRPSVVGGVSHSITVPNLQASSKNDHSYQPQDVFEIELSLHCGVACGKVNCMIIGDPSARHEFFLSGNVLKDLSLAESSSKVNQVCIHSSCYYYLKKYFMLKLIGTEETSSNTVPSFVAPSKCEQKHQPALSTLMEGKTDADDVHSFHLSAINDGMPDMTEEKKKTIVEAAKILFEENEEGKNQNNEIYLFTGHFSEEFVDYLVLNNVSFPVVAPVLSRSSPRRGRRNQCVSFQQSNRSDTYDDGEESDDDDLEDDNENEDCCEEETKEDVEMHNRSSFMLPSSMIANRNKNKQPKKKRGKDKGKINASFASTVSDLSSRMVNSLYDMKSSFLFPTNASFLLLNSSHSVEESNKLGLADILPISLNGSFLNRSSSNNDGLSVKIPSSQFDQSIQQEQQSNKQLKYSIHEIKELLWKSNDPTLSKLFHSATVTISPSNEITENDLTDSQLYSLKVLMRSFIHETVLKSIDYNTCALLNEMRDIVTLFINLDGLEADFNSGMIYKPQLVFLTIMNLIKRTGGSLRQFVVDDKGCVVIICFGLYGSSNSNNGIQAIKLCLLLKKELSKLQCRLSIGITSGVVYCGNVGSEKRCEFVVMGNSVNLAARLMASANSNNSFLYLDTEIRNLAMIKYEFQQTLSIQAKGYDYPIAVYMLINNFLLRRNGFFAGDDDNDGECYTERGTVIGEGSDTRNNTGSSMLVEGVAINGRNKENKKIQFYFSQEIEKQLIEITEMILHPELFIHQLQPQPSSNEQNQAITASSIVTAAGKNVSSLFGSISIVGEESSGKTTFLQRLARNIYSINNKNHRCLFVKLVNPFLQHHRQQKGLTEAYFGIKRILTAFLSLTSSSFSSGAGPSSKGVTGLLTTHSNVVDQFHDYREGRRRSSATSSCFEYSKLQRIEATKSSDGLPTTPHNTEMPLGSVDENDCFSSFPDHIKWFAKHLSLDITLEEMLAFCSGVQCMSESKDEENDTEGKVRNEKLATLLASVESLDPGVGITRQSTLLQLIPLMKLTSTNSITVNIENVEDFLFYLKGSQFIISPLTDFILQTVLQVILGYSSCSHFSPSSTQHSHSEVKAISCASNALVGSFSLTLLLDDLHYCDIETIRIIYAVIDWVSDLKRSHSPSLTSGGTIVTAWLEKHDSSSSNVPTSSSVPSYDVGGTGLKKQKSIKNSAILKMMTFRGNKGRRASTSSQHSSSAAIVNSSNRMIQHHYRIIHEYLHCIKYFSYVTTLDAYNSNSVKSLLYRNLGAKRWEWLVSKHEQSSNSDGKKIGNGNGIPMFGRRNSMVQQHHQQCRLPNGRRFSLSALTTASAFPSLPPLPSSSVNELNLKLTSSTSIKPVRRSSQLIINKIYENTHNGMPSLVYELIASLKSSIDHGIYNNLSDLPVFKARNHTKVLELLDSLNGSELAIIKAASVIGKQFKISLLCEGLSSLSMDYCCSDLILRSALHHLERINVIQLISNTLPFTTTAAAAKKEAKKERKVGLKQDDKRKVDDGNSTDSSGDEEGGDDSEEEDDEEAEEYNIKTNLEIEDEMYYFLDENVRLAIYNLMLESQRTSVHLAIASYYEKNHFVNKNMIDTRTVYNHYMKSGLTDKMTEYSFKMMEELGKKQLYYEAIQHCSTFIGLASGLSTKIILKTILDEIKEQYYYYYSSNNSKIPMKRILKVQNNDNDKKGKRIMKWMKGFTSCLASTEEYSAKSASINILTKKPIDTLYNSLVTVDSPVCLSSSLVKSSTNGGLESSGIRSNNGLLSKFLRSIPFFSSAVGSSYLKKNDVGITTDGQNLFQQQGNSLEQHSTSLSGDGGEQQGKALNRKSIYIRDMNNNQIKIRSSNNTNGVVNSSNNNKVLNVSSYHNILSKSFHRNQFYQFYFYHQDYIVQEEKERSQGNNSLLHWSKYCFSIGNKIEKAKMRSLQGYRPTEKYTKKSKNHFLLCFVFYFFWLFFVSLFLCLLVLNIANLSHVLLGLEKMATLYFW
jgi:class 3 adenylate cyclase/uncharacterized protein (UPF0248 family)